MFMSYLFPFIYLYLHSMTRIKVEGREILIQKIDGSSSWKLSTSIMEGQGEFPIEVHECLKLIQQLKWEKNRDLRNRWCHWYHSLDTRDSSFQLR